MTLVCQIGVAAQLFFQAIDSQRVAPKYEFSATDVSGRLPYGRLQIKSLRTLAPFERGTGQTLPRNQVLALQRVVHDLCGWLLPVSCRICEHTGLTGGRVICSMETESTKQVERLFLYQEQTRLLHLQP